MTIQLHLGDCLDVLRGMADNSVDAVVTDPPYGHNNNNNGDLIHRWETALGRGPHGEARAIANDGAEANEIFRAVLPEFARLLVAAGIDSISFNPDALLRGIENISLAEKGESAERQIIQTSH